jgi:hypothetical protein
MQILGVKKGKLKVLKVEEAKRMIVLSGLTRVDYQYVWVKRMFREDQLQSWKEAGDIVYVKRLDSQTGM